MDREILSILVMNIPKDCKQIIIEKLKYQFRQENFYLNQVQLTIQLVYAKEERNRIYEELVEANIVLNCRYEQAHELLMEVEYLLDENDFSDEDDYFTEVDFYE